MGTARKRFWKIASNWRALIEGYAMSLSSSLNAGVAGLNVNSSKLGSISDNIANSQTTGYKRAETAFSSLVVSEGGKGRYTAGGVRSTTFREVDQRGGVITTSNATDIAIGGRGLIPVTSVASVDNLDGDIPVSYVTSGSFRPDAQGLLRNPFGLALMGWPADINGNIPSFPRESTDGLEPVRINSSALSGQPTTRITLGVNLPAEQSQAGAVGDPIPLSVEYFDNVSAAQSLTFTFTPTVPATGSSNEWTVTVDDSATDAASNPIASFVVTFDDTAALGGTISTITAATGGTYDAVNGTFDVTTASGPIDVAIGVPGDRDGFTQLAAEFQPTGITKDGAAVGSLEQLDINEDGLVRGVFGGGVTRTLYQIPLANFANINGMTALDGQAFNASPESGSLFLWDAGDGPTGSVISNALESSNADIAAELTSLIETQRAYSSNASVIRTVDEMLQETTNLKR